jgi:hypothetical protein
MVSMFALSSADSGFEPPSDQTKDYNICICYFSTELAVLRSKNIDWLAQNHDSVSEWSNMSSGMKIQLSMLV